MNRMRKLQVRLKTISKMQIDSIPDDQRWELSWEIEKYQRLLFTLIDSQKNIDTLDWSEIIVNAWEVHLTIGGHLVSLHREIQSFSKSEDEFDFIVVEGNIYEYIDTEKLKWTNQSYINHYLKLIWISCLSHAPAHVISIPKNRYSNSFSIFALFHEIWHMMVDRKWVNLSEKERNASAWWIKFLRFIERKYEVQICKTPKNFAILGLLTYQISYLLYRCNKIEENCDDEYTTFSSEDIKYSVILRKTWFI